MRLSSPSKLIQHTNELSTPLNLNASSGLKSDIITLKNVFQHSVNHPDFNAAARDYLERAALKIVWKVSTQITLRWRATVVMCIALRTF